MNIVVIPAREGSKRIKKEYKRILWKTDDCLAN